ncbi:MAG: tlde1 domain-containing protein [Candidatus Methylumidiphilus sp.]
MDGIRRGEFRLHPKGPRGIGLGCITLEYRSEFDTLKIDQLHE